MADEQRQEHEPRAPEQPEEEAPEASVLGSLPRGRPGTRSPRREASSRAKRPADGDPEGPTAGEPHGVEDLAWAGIAVAAEAATLGVRLATRTLEAMRDAVDRP